MRLKVSIRKQSDPIQLAELCNTALTGFRSEHPPPPKAGPLQIESLSHITLLGLPLKSAALPRFGHKEAAIRSLKHDISRMTSSVSNFFKGVLVHVVKIPPSNLERLRCR